MRILFAIGMMLFAITHHCHAQMLISDIFAGTNTYTTSFSDTAVIGVGTTATASVGPGYNGTLYVGLAAAYSETMAINGSPGTFTLSGAGVAGVAGTFDANKTFTGTDLAASTTYTFTLTAASGASVALLSALNFTVSQGGTTVASTSLGTGLTNGTAINLVSLFSSTTSTATFTFTTPSTLNTSSPVVIDMNGGSLASLLGSSVEFTDVSIAAVPEPSTWALLGMGVVALGVVFRKRNAGMKLARVEKTLAA